MASIAILSRLLEDSQDDAILPPVRLPARNVFALHAVFFFVFAWWSWLKWPDPLIDFGRELYVPWQILRGKVLYRDLESLFGPLSPHLNALWFRLFGVSLLTLVVVNLAIFAAIVAAVHHVVYKLSDRFTATAASLVTIALFGFLQLGGVGNYNFVTPYAHEATHGFGLSVALLLILHTALLRRRLLLGGLAGTAFGLVLLTKVEIVAAAAACTVVAFLAIAAQGSDERRFLRGIIPVFVMTATIPTIAFFLYLRRYMPSGIALRGVTRGWLGALDIANTGKTFYLNSSGLDHPAFNVIRMILITGGLLVYVAAIIVLSSHEARYLPPLVKRVGRLVVMVLAATAMWLGVERALPLVALLIFGSTLILFLRYRQHQTTAMRLLLGLMWSTFAVVLLAKLALDAKLHHYGFYLALPATTLAIVAACWLIPRALVDVDNGNASQEFRRWATICMMLALVPYLATAVGVYATKTVSIGRGPDRFFASQTDRYWQGVAARDALEFVRSQCRHGDTLAVVPEGVMLNYLARLDSPLSVINLMPLELGAFGEDRILDELRAAPPRFVMLVHKNVSEYGYAPFGTDSRYGNQTYKWIASRYRPIRGFGNTATARSGYGIELFERN